jgi:hypothetical protein
MPHLLFLSKDEEDDAFVWSRCFAHHMMMMMMMMMMIRKDSFGDGTVTSVVVGCDVRTPTGTTHITHTSQYGYSIVFDSLHKHSKPYALSIS